MQRCAQLVQRLMRTRNSHRRITHLRPGHKPPHVAMAARRVAGLWHNTRAGPAVANAGVDAVGTARSGGWRACGMGIATTVGPPPAINAVATASPFAASSIRSSDMRPPMVRWLGARRSTRPDSGAVCTTPAPSESERAVRAGVPAASPCADAAVGAGVADGACEAGLAPAAAAGAAVKLCVVTVKSSSLRRRRAGR